MEGGEPAGLEAADGGLSPAELVERELEALRAVAGVVSASAQERQRRQPLNTSMVKVRLEGVRNVLTVHCSASVPNLLVAAQRVAAKVAAALGSDAVAEGRRRVESAREEEAAAAGGGCNGTGQLCAAAQRCICAHAARQAARERYFSS